MRFPHIPVNDLPDATRNFETLQAILTPSWQPLAYGTNYADFGPAVQAGTYALSFTGGLVTVRGVLKKTAAFVYGETMATLPAGYRPAGREIFTCFGTDATNGNFTGRVDVQTSGLITLVASQPSIGAPGLISALTLSGISFQQGN